VADNAEETLILGEEDNDSLESTCLLNLEKEFYSKIYKVFTAFSGNVLCLTLIFLTGIPALNGIGRSLSQTNQIHKQFKSCFNTFCYQRHPKYHLSQKQACPLH